MLFADVEPADACQGRVGNCWLIAALSALAEFPAYFKNKIFITKKAGTKVRDNFRKVELLFFDEELKVELGWKGDRSFICQMNLPGCLICFCLIERLVIGCMT